MATLVRSPVAVHQAGDVLRIGRHEDNDIVLPDLRASRFHAELRHIGDAYEIVDLGSTNGIHLNGQDVTRARLTQGDRVSVARHDFVFDGAHLHEFVDTGPASLFADDLSVQIGKATLLDDVSFAVQEGSLVGIIGPSGCGKSTLIKAVTGLRPANQGRVQYDGRNLYEEYAELRYRIGMVPQDDVLHRQLTVRRALRFAASLRFADDVPRKERLHRVDEVIGMLGLSDRANQRITTLSGGQRKRTSVALELLTEPSLLCLDEPTSGLDPALDREVMRELRRLADSGRTVIVVTHSVLHLAMCDRVLVMCLGGRMGYFGPPEGVLEFFGAADYADVFEMITSDANAWSLRYRNSDVYREHVGEVVLQLTTGGSVQVPPTAAVEAVPAASPTAAATPAPAPAGAPASTPAPNTPVTNKRRNPVGALRQLMTLSARMIAVILSDRGYALFLLGLPLVLALLSHAVPGKLGLGPDHTFTLEAQRLLVVLAVGASFIGIAVSIREVVGESAIYARERAVGISAGAYLGLEAARVLHRRRDSVFSVHVAVAARPARSGDPADLPARLARRDHHPGRARRVRLDDPRPRRQHPGQERRADDAGAGRRRDGAARALRRPVPAHGRQDSRLDLVHRADPLGLLGRCVERRSAAHAAGVHQRPAVGPHDIGLVAVDRLALRAGGRAHGPRSARAAPP